VSAQAAPAERGLPGALRLPRALPRLGPAPLLTAALAAALVAIVFEADGGLRLGPVTTVEIGVDLAAGLLGAAALLAGRRARRPWGVGTLGLLALLAAFTAVSIVWAVDPSDAW
jgi:peptidoglycan/LPS O-acetylase OafA/YrhL